MGFSFILNSDVWLLAGEFLFFVVKAAARASFA